MQVLPKNNVGWCLIPGSIPDKEGDHPKTPFKTEKALRMPSQCFSILAYSSYHSKWGFYWENEILPDEDLDLPVIPKWYKWNKSADCWNTVPKIYADYARNTFFPHRKIVLLDANAEGEWMNGEPSEWYNLPIGSLYQSGKPVVLEPVTSRKYITIEKKFNKIVLDSFVKGEPLSCEDVLFAARALCCDETRSYDGFSVISDSEGILHLEVDIDNFST